MIYSEFRDEPTMDPSAVGEVLHEEPQCPSSEILGDRRHAHVENEGSNNVRQSDSRDDQGFRRIVRNFTPS